MVASVSSGLDICHCLTLIKHNMEANASFGREIIQERAEHPFISNMKLILVTYLMDIIAEEMADPRAVIFHKIIKRKKEGNWRVMIE